MANEEHLKILKQGVEVWNKWRAKNVVIEPDLSDAQLAKILLQEANLSDANLTHADFSEANLAAADLSSALLTVANLGEASLEAANLMLTELTDANLAGTNLVFTRFDGTELKAADFTNATIGFSTFAAVDLSSVIGLNTVKHDGPSTIGIDTLYLSKGRISETFLRGCGVPEDFITYARSLVTNPIEYYSSFISHSSRDKDFVERLYADLQARNVRCWYAPEDLKIGDKFRTRIEESIRLYDKVMIVLSENSIQSAWVEEEVEAALERERQHKGSHVLFPIRLDDAIMETTQAWAASLRRTRHIGNFSNWKNHDSYQKAFDRLLRDLQSETKAAPAR